MDEEFTSTVRIMPDGRERISVLSKSVVVYVRTNFPNTARNWTQSGLVFRVRIVAEAAMAGVTVRKYRAATIAIFKVKQASALRVNENMSHIPSPILKLQY